MCIDQQYIGFALPLFYVTVDPDRMAAFAVAIGDRGDVAPATFLKVIEGDNNSSRAILTALKVDLKRVLHVEQQFNYHSPVRAGDRLAVQRTVSDIQTKRGGTMEVIVIGTTFVNQDDLPVASSRQVVLVRHPADKVNENDG